MRFQGDKVLLLRTIERGDEEWVIVTADKQLPIKYFGTESGARRWAERYEMRILNDE